MMLQTQLIHLVSSSMPGDAQGIQIANVDLDNLDD